MDSDPRESDTVRSASGGPTVAEARAALDALDVDASQLAARIVTPWWYHVALGAVTALAISSLSVLGLSPAAVIPLVVIWMPFMLTAYTTTWRVLISRPASRRSRRALLLSLVVIGAILALAVLLTTTSLSPWWGALPTAAGFAATVLLGRRYDAVLRAEITRPDTHR
ncbi:hypothetical protein ACT3SP_00605 [Brachybacterium sp. AOP43-C2-M15]|uniref:hypothetical protein n=1 Tax=Brachybacterium sp. AOP43-C2-M15 TaxID=3457661 RepID=UPI004033838B